jgi:hypothetical protein
MPLVVTSPDETARLDALAEATLARLAPLSFEPAATVEDRDVVLRMRFDCMVELGWVRPEERSDGRAVDAYDAGATFLVARDGGVAVGSMRVVPPDAERPLPAEREFGIPLRSRDGVFEFGRLVMPARYRPGRSHRVIAGLCSRGWLEARAAGCVRVLSTATRELIELYRSLGLQIVVLGPPQPYWGEQRVPIEITGARRREPDTEGRAAPPSARGAGTAGR